MPLPASSRLQLTPDLDICRILNGMWQVSGAHGPIDPRRAIGEMFSDHGRRVYHPGPRRPLDGERPEVVRSGAAAALCHQPRVREFLRSHGTYRLSRHGHDRGCFARQGHKFDLVTGASRMDHHNPVDVPPVIPVPAASARRPHRAFPAKAGTHCVPRMALNLEVKVLFGRAP